jgi:hypothetical protein
MDTASPESVFKPSPPYIDRPKPMRLRVMELPSEVVGDDVTTPFLLIIDRCNADQAERIKQLPPNWVAQTGAKFALFLEDEVELS